MRRVVLVLMTVALAVPVMAQENPGADHPIFGRAQEAVSRFLQLGEDQVDQWNILITNHHAIVEPLRADRRTAAQELKDLLAADPPDPTAIGEKVLEIEALNQAIRTANQDYVAGFEALLDEEQAGRLGFMRRAEHVQPLIPAFRAVGLLGPAPPPEEQGEGAPVGPGPQPGSPGGGFGPPR